MMNTPKTIQMNLKDGQLLTLEVSDLLLRKVKEAFMLNSTEDVTDSQVKYFIMSSMKNALQVAQGHEHTPL